VPGLEKAKEESLPLLEKFAGELDDLEERFLNSRINNIEDRPFLERDGAIQSIVAEMKKTQRLKINKPRVVCLWSPRGTGKSSVIRRLAKMDEYAESRRCGRLLVFDAQQMNDLQETKCSTLVSAMVLWHLLQLLDGYGVKLAGQVVNFNRMKFTDVVELVKRSSTPLTGRLSSFEAWVRSSCKMERDVFKQWCLVTAAAFNAQQDCACLVLLDQTEWLDIFNAGAAFPTGASVLVPLVWWFRDQKRRKLLAQKARELNISLEGLLPDPADLLQAPQQGPLSRGTLWEEQVCNALAARFHLFCLAADKTPCDTYIPFLDIYPTTDDHLRSVLEQFSVCWSDGVEYPKKEASVLDRVGKAIKCNKNFKSAHHDLLIPVKRIETGQLEYIAAQCRCGSPKTAAELTTTYQDKTRKPRTSDPSSEVPDMTNVLLQICSTREGTQKFQKATPWAKRQEEKRYSLMSCKAIIAQLHMLRIL
ncbi:Uncharacterized protein SCF082_LOCUS16720, partial [Durusdinium trenchii]